MKIALVLVAGLVVGLVAGMFLLAPVATPSISAPQSMDAELAAAHERIASLEAELDRARAQLREPGPEGGSTPPLSTPAADPAVDEPPASVHVPGPDSSPGTRPLEPVEPELSVEEVRRMLMSDDPREMVGGLRMIDRLGNREEAIAHARRILELGSNPPWLPTMALRTLAALGGPEAVAAVTPTLGADPPWLVSAAVRTLEEIGDPSAIPALRATLPAADPRQRIDIAVVLRQLGDPELSDEVAREATVLLSSPDSRQRAAAVRTFSLLRDPAHNVLLVQQLSDESSDIRQTAIGVLAQQGTLAEIPALQAMLSDPLPDVAGAAERAIRFIELRQEQGGAAPPGTPPPGER